MRFIETPIFTEDVSNELSLDEYRAAPRCGGVQMKQKDFDRLVTSIKQAGAIRRGRFKPSRVTEFHPADTARERAPR